MWGSRTKQREDYSEVEMGESVRVPREVEEEKRDSEEREKEKESEWEGEPGSVRTIERGERERRKCESTERGRGGRESVIVPREGEEGQKAWYCQEREREGKRVGKRTKGRADLKAMLNA